MPYKATYQSQLHPYFVGRPITTTSTTVKSTGIATQLELLYLFNGDYKSRPAVVNNLIPNGLYDLDMVWNGPGWLLGNGGAQFVDNGNVVLNTAGTMRNVDSDWAIAKGSKSRLAIISLEFKQQSIAQVYIHDGYGFSISRTAAGTAFTIAFNNQSSHGVSWSIDTEFLVTGSLVNIAAVINYSTNSSLLYINGISFGAGTLSGDPFAGGTVAQRPLARQYIGRTASWADYYGFDGKIGLVAHSANLTGNVPPSASELKQLSIDPYSVILDVPAQTSSTLPTITLPNNDWSVEFDARFNLTNQNKMWPLLTKKYPFTSGYPCDMSNSGGYISVPNWSRSTGNGAQWIVSFDIEVKTLLNNNFHLFSTSASTAGGFRILTTGSILWRSNTTDYITTPPGTIVTNKRYTISLARVSDIRLEIKVNGTVVGFFEDGAGLAAGATSSATNINQVGRFSTGGSDVINSEYVLYGFEFTQIAAGTTPATYSDSWSYTTVTSTDSLIWQSVSTTRNATITQCLKNPWSRTPYVSGLSITPDNQLILSTKEYPTHYSNQLYMSGIYGNNPDNTFLLMPSWAANASSTWSFEISMYLDFPSLPTGVAASLSVWSNGALNALRIDKNTSEVYSIIANAGSDIVSYTLPSSILQKWVTIKLWSNSTTWNIDLDGVTVASTSSTSATLTNLVRIVSNVLSDSEQYPVLVRSVTLTGGTYASTWNEVSATGYGKYWPNTANTRNITLYSDKIYDFYWKSISEHRLVETNTNFIVPNERRQYKIARESGVINAYVDGVSFPLIKGNINSNGIEVDLLMSTLYDSKYWANGSRIYSITINGETWTPTSSSLESSVSSERNASSDNVVFNSIPTPQVYCTNNSTAYSTFSAIPNAVLTAGNPTVLEVSGFVRDNAPLDLTTTGTYNLLIKSSSGQEFVGKFHDDDVATWAFTDNDSATQLTISPDNNSTISIQDIETHTSAANGSFETPFSITGAVVLSLSRCGMRYFTNLYQTSYDDGFFAAFKDGGTNDITISHCIFDNFGQRSLYIDEAPTSISVSNVTLLPGIKASSDTYYLTNTPISKSVVYSKDIASVFSTEDASLLTTVASDTVASYGLYVTPSDFVDFKNQDYRLVPNSKLYLSNIGAFSPAYQSPVNSPKLEIQSVYGIAPEGVLPYGALKVYDTPAGPVLKRWDGATWQVVTLKRWDGATWQVVTLKRWDGATWQ